MKGVSLQGYNSKYVTMLVKGELKAGDLVAMGGNNTVEKAVNKRFVGVAHAIRDGYALVQTGGFAVLGYSGNAPAVGFAKMQADANADAVLNEGGYGQQKRRYPVLEAEKIRDLQKEFLR